MRTPAPSADERIQKVLARSGVGSRRQVEQWIREGRLMVNGAAATLGTKIGARDRISLDGRTVRVHATQASAVETVVCHRSSSRPDASPFESMSRLPGRAGRRWIPISPLPAHDSGLELLTTDGDLAHAFTRHFSQVHTEYALRMFGDPRLDQLEQLKAGLLENGETLKIEALELEGGEGINRWFKLTTLGAGARDVHRLCSATGLQLNRLIRVRLGPVTMDRALSRGRVRPLEAQELVDLYQLAGLPPPAEAVESVNKEKPPRVERQHRPAEKESASRERSDRGSSERSAGRPSDRPSSRAKDASKKRSNDRSDDRSSGALRGKSGGKARVKPGGQSGGKASRGTDKRSAGGRLKRGTAGSSKSRR